jgi:enoyl-CoA hydratase/carnithine racemase
VIVEAKDLGGGICLLTLNRPPANAINRDLNQALFRACRAARDDTGVRAVIVSGVGKFFSAGLDLKEATSGRIRMGNLAGSEDDGFFALWTMPKPTVAMVNGHAIAGGLIIALACDFRITAQGAHRFGLNEVEIGLAFPIGAFEIARLALSNHGLRWATLEAGLYGPSRALELGFVDEVVEPERLEPRCVELAGRLATVAGLAYAHTKRAIQRRAVMRALSQTAEETREIGDIASSAETRERIAAHVRSLSGR